MTQEYKMKKDISKLVKTYNKRYKSTMPEKCHDDITNAILKFISQNEIANEMIMVLRKKDAFPKIRYYRRGLHEDCGWFNYATNEVAVSMSTGQTCHEVNNILNTFIHELTHAYQRQYEKNITRYNLRPYGNAFYDTFLHFYVEMYACLLTKMILKSLNVDDDTTYAFTKAIDKSIHNKTSEQLLSSACFFKTIKDLAKSNCFWDDYSSCIALPDHKSYYKHQAFGAPIKEINMHLPKMFTKDHVQETKKEIYDEWAKRTLYVINNKKKVAA